jgi:uncharacterized protein YegP (UPF0339 family)
VKTGASDGARAGLCLPLSFDPVFHWQLRTGNWQLLTDNRQLHDSTGRPLHHFGPRAIISRELSLTPGTETTVRKLLCSLALFAAVGTLVATAPAAQPKNATDKKDDEKKEDPQDKKTDTKKGDTKKTDAKKDDPKKAEVGAIEVYQAKDGWRFRITTADGKSLAIGVQGYEKKDDCLAAVELLKTAMATAKLKEPSKDEKK